MFNTFSPKQLFVLCGFASASLLIAAFGFEYIGGLAPCKLCLWQRWPHAGIITFSILGATGGLRAGLAFLLIVLFAAITAAIAGYHVGVEQQFWPGPSSCSGTVAAISTADMLDRLLATPVVKCDEIAWSFAGVSMAGWNMLLSAGLAGFALLARRNGAK